MTNGKDYCELLTKYPRAIVHLRSQVRKLRFGTVLGAGISVDFGAPSWKKLITDIAADAMVNARDVADGDTFKGMSAPYQTEVLFQKFRSEFVKTLHDLTSIEEQNTVAAEWLTICQKYLYQTPPIDVAEKLREHPFMGAWGCKKFCVNGLLAGNCRLAWSNDDRREESVTHRTHRRAASELQEA